MLLFYTKRQISVDFCLHALLCCYRHVVNFSAVKPIENYIYLLNIPIFYKICACGYSCAFHFTLLNKKILFCDFINCIFLLSLYIQCIVRSDCLTPHKSIYIHMDTVGINTTNKTGKCHIVIPSESQTSFHHFLIFFPSTEQCTYLACHPPKDEESL